MEFVVLLRIGSLHIWVKEEEKQVTLNGAASSFLNVNCGVPQGSILDLY